MTKKLKTELFSEICSRIPYGLQINYKGDIYDVIGAFGNDKLLCVKPFMSKMEVLPITKVKLYLKPLYDLSIDEFNFLTEHIPYDFSGIYSGRFYLYDDIHKGNSVSIDDMNFLLTCSNKWHYDYLDWIDKGFALKAPDEMYD